MTTPLDKEDFSWFKPTVDDSKPMAWNDFMTLHMRARYGDVGPKVQLKAVSNRWKERANELKCKGSSSRSRILPVPTPGMYGGAGGKINKHPFGVVKKPHSSKQRTELLNSLLSALGQEDLPKPTITQRKKVTFDASSTKPSKADTDTDTEMEEPPTKSAITHSHPNPLNTFVRDVMQRKTSDGFEVNRYSIHPTKKNQRIFTRCLQEACRDINSGNMTAREALLRGVTIPFDYLSRGTVRKPATERETVAVPE